MGGQPWGNGHMNTYVQYPKLKKHVNCIVYGAGVAKNWKNREWRMLACTYKGGNFTNSVNGQETRNVRASGADGGTDTFFPARHDGKRFGSIQSFW